jgi:hypothetical protein
MKQGIIKGKKGCIVDNVIVVVTKRKKNTNILMIFIKI